MEHQGAVDGLDIDPQDEISNMTKDLKPEKSGNQF